MELFTSVWVIFILYCTEWFGIRQCFAVPLPTLANYHQGYYSKNNWNDKYRQTRYPEIYNEKFVFPNKQQEIMPMLNIADRSGFAGSSSGKIFFPDEVPDVLEEKRYQFPTDNEARPVWETNYRPTTADSSSLSKWPTLSQMKSAVSAEDGSIRMESPTAIQEQLSKTILNAKMGSNSQQSINFKKNSQIKMTEQERVQEAVQEFYKWLKLSRARSKGQQNLQKGTESPTTRCPETGNGSNGNLAGTSSTSKNNHGSAVTKPDPVISDQSLVAGLKDQKCPEGQIRLENGECRVKVEI